jgi:hypothetical protein
MDERMLARALAYAVLGFSERGFAHLPEHIKEDKVNQEMKFILKRPVGRPPGSGASNTGPKRPVGRPPKTIS